VVSEFRDGAVLLDLRTKQYLVLNPTGGLVCRLLAGGALRDELARALSEAFQVAREDADRDVARFLAVLNDEGLVATV
jgi:hypothetical protein